MRKIKMKSVEQVKSWKSVIMALLFMIPTVFGYLMSVDENDWFALTKFSLILVLLVLVIVVLVMIYNKLWFDDKEIITKDDGEE